MDDFNIDWGNASWDTTESCAIINGSECSACEG